MAGQTKKQKLDQAVQTIKDLTTAGGEGDEEQGFQLEAGETIRDLMNFFNETFPGAFEQEEGGEGEGEGEQSMTQAQRIFG